MASGGNRHPDAASGGLHVATNGRRVTARRPSASDSTPLKRAPRAGDPAAATAPRRRRGHGQYRVESRRRRQGRARTTSCTRPRAAGTFLAPASRRSESTARADHHLCGNQPVCRVHPTILHEVISRRRRVRPGSVERRRTGIATPSSRRRVDGVEDDAMMQHERAVKF